MKEMRAEEVKRVALESGFELAGIAPAEPVPEAAWYAEWVRAGMAGEMRYLTDHRGEMRLDPRTLLPSARSILGVGKLYNGPEPHSTEFDDDERAWISRYAWGDDYHEIVRRALERVVERLQGCVSGNFDFKICVDTAPLLERALARRAGLGWIGKNTCLIREGAGSWFFLGEILLSIDLECDSPPPDRCGTCTRCIDACPTRAIVPTGRAEPAWALDSRLCISYLTIELRGAIPESERASMGRNVFGCDICQDVCPWSRFSKQSEEERFAPREGVVEPKLRELAEMSQEEFSSRFRKSAIKRTKLAGLRRNALTVLRGKKRTGHAE